MCNCCLIFQVSFFCHCTDFMRNVYSVTLTVQNTKQPEETAGGKEGNIWEEMGEGEEEEGVEINHDGRLYKLHLQYEEGER